MVKQLLPNDFQTIYGPPTTTMNRPAQKGEELDRVMVRSIYAINSYEALTDFFKLSSYSGSGLESFS